MGAFTDQIRSAQTPGFIRGVSTRDFPRELVGVASSVGVQSRLVRPRNRHRGSLVPIKQAVLRVRGTRRQHAAIGAGMDMPVRRGPRPRHQRGQEHSGGRAGRVSVRRWCETAPHLVQGGVRR